MSEKKVTYTDHYIRSGKLIESEVWLREHLVLETIMGSHAFGTNNEDSDYDICAIVMPKREHIYPQQYGKILGLDEFEFFRRMELKGPAEKIIVNRKEVEIEFTSLVTFFDLAGFKGSPLVEVLFVRPNLVTYGTKVGFTLRDNRKLFVSLKNIDAIKGFAISQMRRIRSRQPVATERKVLIEKYGYDIRMASHVLRTLYESIQLLQTGDMDLMYNNEEYKIMKQGDWGSIEKLEDEFKNKIEFIEKLRTETKIPVEPPYEKLRALLAGILEERYGSISGLKQSVEFISTADVKKMLNMIGEKIDTLSSRLS